MIKQVVFAIGADAFEKRIIEYLNTEDSENTYVLAHSATHLDRLQDVCARLRPQVLIIREGLGDKKIDFLDLIRQLTMSITGMQIVVLARPRQPGDPFLTGLVMYQVYDFDASGKLTIESVGDMVLSPRSIQDVSNYVPEINLKQNGTQFSFSSPGTQSEATSNGNPVVDNAPLQDISDSYRSVNHVSTLNEIDTHEDETSLFTEKQNKAGGYMDIGSRLSYNPLFQPVTKKQEEHRPVLHAKQKEEPQLFGNDEEDLSMTTPSTSPKPTPEPQKAPSTSPRRSPETKKPLSYHEDAHERSERPIEHHPMASERKGTFGERPRGVSKSERYDGGLSKRGREEEVRTRERSAEPQVDARQVDFTGLFSIYNTEEVEQQMALLKKVLSRASVQMLDDPLSVNEKAVNVVTSLYREASSEYKKRPHDAKPKAIVKPAPSTQQLERPVHSEQKGSLTATPRYEEAVEKAVEAKLEQRVKESQGSGPGSTKVEEAVSEAPQKPVQKPEPETVVTDSRKLDGEPRLVASEPRKVEALESVPVPPKTESVDERLQRLSQLRGEVAGFDVTAPPVQSSSASISNTDSGINNQNIEQVASSTQLVPQQPAPHPNQDQQEPTVFSLPKKCIVFLKDSTNDNMVAFNFFARLALQAKKCVYVRFKKKDAEDFQFDTLKEKGCNIEMLENPNIYDIQGKIDDSSIDHIIIDIPSSTDFRFTQRVLQESDIRILDVDQNSSRARERAGQLKNLMSGLSHVVMIAGYDANHLNEQADKVLRSLGASRRIATIDMELMQEGLGDEPYALNHTEEFDRKVKEMVKEIWNQ